MTDDQRWDQLEQMPYVMEHVVGEGIRFENAFVTTPICCPSRASFLTGRYAHGHGIWSNGGAPWFDASSTLAVWLQRAGYRTALVGKYLLDNGKLAPEVPPGWDTWVTFADTPEMLEGASLYYDYVLNVNGSMVPRGRDERDYSTDVLAEFAVSFLREAGAEPFFLFFNPFAPHGPMMAAPRHEGSLADLPLGLPADLGKQGTEGKPAYVAQFAAHPVFQDPLFLERARKGRIRGAEALLAVDEAVERIMETLSALGVLDDTLIVYTSDNGFLFGEHGIVGKHVPYEEAVRVPLAVRLPRLAPGPGRDEHLVLNLDLAPTLVELARAEAPDTIDGSSLVPLLRGAAKGEDVAWRSDLLIEGERQPLMGEYHAVRSERWKYIATGSDDRFEELYDLRRDPKEEENLLFTTGDDPSVRERAAGMGQRLADLEAGSADRSAPTQRPPDAGVRD